MIKQSNQSNKLNSITVQDKNWEGRVKDHLKHEERDIRNLLVAAKVLRFLREKNHSQTWLAKQMGLSAQRVGVILKGRGNMTVESIGQLEDATGLTLFVVPAGEPAASVIQRKTTWHGRIAAASGYTLANILSPATGDAQFVV